MNIFKVVFNNSLVHLMCWQFNFILSSVIEYFNMAILSALFSICVEYSQYNQSLCNVMACQILLCM